MPDSKRSLNIFYRHVHIKADKASRDPNKRRPVWFSHEVCFQNLLSTIRLDPLGHHVNLMILYDGTLEDFTSDFIANYYSAYGLNIQFINGGSDMNSAMIALDLARRLDLPAEDLIYFLENDYMHQFGWISKLFELYDSGIQFDYVSLYDHRDKYHYEMYASLTSRIVYSQSHHWRTAPSTCGSFITKKCIFDRDWEVFNLFLTDYNLFSKLVAEMGRVLLTPMPGLSTHSMEGYLSPTIDWEKLALDATVGL